MVPDLLVYDADARAVSRCKARASGLAGSVRGGVGCWDWAAKAAQGTSGASGAMARARGD